MSWFWVLYPSEVSGKSNRVTLVVLRQIKLSIFPSLSSAIASNLFRLNRAGFSGDY
ncbi:MAG: hypothetical protein KA318_05385 [Nitrosomonas sp.]|nr:hypothetical protein [Nitrosomonas sp.]